ncbi:TlpA family protein disulfide reductase [Chitinophaga horti]|uniref:TlpA family protein disulfide reductase n=1 Tax=Chitinophaga horti TaxID=2920382 RepID=A0ABY6IUK3_9BACT|nr:TlpA disulfide reductase family protein [Chitinophaga horti]UYQ90970.1 TlpA family protein disulfide reductase [Chitinophaga horti]
MKAFINLSIFLLGWFAVSGQSRPAAFPFELKDTLGRVVRLDDFKGKVVYMDFWFTGCKGCVQVAKGLHEAVLPVFKADTNVVFLAVSLDINFLQWKKSIRAGLYTSEGETNLYTMGMGGDHPIYKHYGFSGAPQTLLIDKQGLLISSSPPLPGPDLVELIRGEL